MHFYHLLILFTIGLLTARAEEFAAPLFASSPASSDWQYTGVVYAPLMGLDGRIGIGSVSSSVDLPFSDILKNLDAGLTGAVEARHNCWSVTGDFIWLKLSASIDPTVDSDVSLKQEELMASLAMGYQLYGDGQTTFDLLGGAALTRLDANLNFSTPNLHVAERSFSGSESWVDPFVGLRLRHRLSDRWAVFATGLYGGFGVGSDKYWQVLAGVNYRMSERASIALAYRIIATDYQNGAFLYDVETSGPNLGVVFHF